MICPGLHQKSAAQPETDKGMDVLKTLYFPKTTSSNTMTSFTFPELFLLCNREGMDPEASFPDHAKSHIHC